jgi:indole-3-glycerol phosphate synthase
MIPPDILFVSESGVRGPADIRSLRACGTDAVLIGELLMKAEDRKKTLAELRGAL